jgi:hypothetical protein
MIKEEFIFIDAELESETVTLTRAEIDALTAYAEKLRRETIKAIFTDVEDLLWNRERLEWGRSHNMETSLTTRFKHRYAMNVCETLLKDLQKIEGKYTDEANKV